MQVNRRRHRFLLYQLIEFHVHQAVIAPTEIYNIDQQHILFCRIEKRRALL
jgi:hypothetical protein